MQSLERECRSLPPGPVDQEQLLSPLHVQGDRNPETC